MKIKFETLKYLYKNSMNYSLKGMIKRDKNFFVREIKMVKNIN